MQGKGMQRHLIVDKAWRRQEDIVENKKPEGTNGTSYIVFVKKKSKKK